MARRVAVCSICSDNGTIQSAALLQENAADWIVWHNNPPGASYKGGVRKCQI